MLIKELRKNDIVEMNLNTIAKILLKEFNSNNFNITKEFFKSCNIFKDLFNYYNYDAGFNSYFSQDKYENQDIFIIETINKEKIKKRHLIIFFDKKSNLLEIKKIEFGILPENKYVECEEKLSIELNKINKNNIDFIKIRYEIFGESSLFLYENNYFPKNKRMIDSAYGTNSYFHELANEINENKLIIKDFFDLLNLKYDYKNEKLEKSLMIRFNEIDIIKENNKLYNALKKQKIKKNNII